jgi:hypothetical protein
LKLLIGSGAGALAGRLRFEGATAPGNDPFGPPDTSSASLSGARRDGATGAGFGRSVEDAPNHTHAAADLRLRSMPRACADARRGTTLSKPAKLALTGLSCYGSLVRAGERYDQSKCGDDERGEAADRLASRLTQAHDEVDHRVCRVSAPSGFAS